jgi:hypothetical protein
MTSQHLIITAAALFMTSLHVAAVEPDCKAVQTPNQQRDIDTIKRIELGWLTSEFHGNVDFLDCLLTPGYAAISTKDNLIRSKADLLGNVAPNKGKTTQIPPLETTVVVNGDQATAYSVMKGHKKTGEPYESRFVDSYVFKDGAWHAVGGVDL